MNENPNYIVKEHPALIRMLAARHMTYIYGRYIFGFVLFYVLEEWIPNLLGLIFPESYFALFQGAVDPQIFVQVPSVPFVYIVYMVLMGGVLVLGRTLFLMTALRNRQVEYGILLEGMPFYGRATVIYLLQMSMLAAGLSLFIVPGIYLFYLYSQAMYIFADDPNKGPVRCLRESRMMMRGNIAAMIRLDLMYLTIILFGFMPYVVVWYFAAPDPKTLFGMFTFFLCRFTLYVALANVFMGRVTFYELMKSRGFGNFKYAGEKDFRESIR